jgi:glucosamine-phosphate N-acetyltransferase
MQVLFSQVDSSLLFNPSLISQKLQQDLPSGFVLRPLNINDFDKGTRCLIEDRKTSLNFLGFAKTLGQLSVTEGLTKPKFERKNDVFHFHNKYMLEIFNSLRKFNTYVVVIEDVLKSQIIAAGTLLVELKFLRGGGLVGHIEDIVTDKNYRGKNLGKM